MCIYIYMYTHISIPLHFPFRISADRGFLSWLAWQHENSRGRKLAAESLAKART